MENYIKSWKGVHGDSQHFVLLSYRHQIILCTESDNEHILMSNTKCLCVDSHSFSYSFLSPLFLCELFPQISNELSSANKRKDSVWCLAKGNGFSRVILDQSLRSPFWDTSQQSRMGDVNKPSNLAF